MAVNELVLPRKGTNRPDAVDFLGRSQSEKIHELPRCEYGGLLYRSETGKVSVATDDVRCIRLECTIDYRAIVPVACNDPMSLLRIHHRRRGLDVCHEKLNRIRIQSELGS